MKRTVILTVTNDDVDGVEATHLDEGVAVGGESVPVPPNDQLTRALDTLTRYHLGAYPSREGDAAMLVRAAAGLDDE